VTHLNGVNFRRRGALLPNANKADGRGLIAGSRVFLQCSRHALIASYDRCYRQRHAVSKDPASKPRRSTAGVFARPCRAGDTADFRRVRISGRDRIAGAGSGGSSPWLTWGRLRYDHTQGIMLGWLGNAFFAFLYHALPVLTGRRVTARDWGSGSSDLELRGSPAGWILVLAVTASRWNGRNFRW